MIICDNIDDIKKAVWDLGSAVRGKHGKCIQTRCELVGLDPTRFYKYTSSRCDITTDTLCKLLDAFGYQIAIVKRDENGR